MIDCRQATAPLVKNGLLVLYALLSGLLSLVYILYCEDRWSLHPLHQLSSAPETTVLLKPLVFPNLPPNSPTMYANPLHQNMVSPSQYSALVAASTGGGSRSRAPQIVPQTYNRSSKWARATGTTLYSPITFGAHGIRLVDAVGSRVNSIEGAHDHPLAAVRSRKIMLYITVSVLFSYLTKQKLMRYDV
jgi:hypothetical protein